MNGISGFTFIHNALNGGYPVFEAMAVVLPYVDEMVVVDMASDDGTRELLERVVSSCTAKNIKIMDGEWWPGKAGRCLSYNHSLHEQHCQYDTIWHFEADEVFDSTLARAIQLHVRNGHNDLAVQRIQLEQNFQRVRWYPEAVHRVFPRGSAAKSGHTTTRHDDAKVLPIDFGLLWDITNCFRDNWIGRVEQQAELWGSDPNALHVPLHVVHDHNIKDLAVFLEQAHWTWTDCPFRLPAVLHQHVGITKYVPNFDFFGFKVN